MIEARVVLDSISPAGIRLTTFQLRYPKFIHGEVMTHRRFSRNASSSRAIPVAKMLAEVRDDALRAAPEYWGAEQKGMASGEELEDKPYWVEGGYGGPSQLQAAKSYWTAAARRATYEAEGMVRLGLHKSIVNRILEPYLHINVLVSATEYLNFFGLRLDKAAQPEIRILAERMWAAWNESTPTPLKVGEWHRPFIEDVDYSVAVVMAPKLPTMMQFEKPVMEILNRISVARNARVSYQSFETERRSNVEEDLALYERLVGAQPLHASPAEHVATPDERLYDWPDGCHECNQDVWRYPQQHGNFTGWRQLRKMLPGEAVAPLPAGYVYNGS